MIRADIPGGTRIELEHVVCDFNGTLALDGNLIEGVRARLTALASVVTVHVVTADTFGAARSALDGLELRLTVLRPTEQARAKAGYVEQCGAGRTAAIGNGCNDRAMVAAAALGIAVTGPEGAAAETLAAASVVVPDVLAALDLLLRPQRLVATLRR